MRTHPIAMVNLAARSHLQRPMGGVLYRGIHASTPSRIQRNSDLEWTYPEYELEGPPKAAVGTYSDPSREIRNDEPRDDAPRSPVRRSIEKILELATQDSPIPNASATRSHNDIIPDPSQLPPWIQACLSTSPSQNHNTDPDSHSQRLWLLGFLSGCLSRSNNIQWYKVANEFNSQFSTNFTFEEIAALIVPASADLNTQPEHEPENQSSADLSARLQAPLTVPQITWLIAYITVKKLSPSQTPDSGWEAAAKAFRKVPPTPKVLDFEEFISKWEAEPPENRDDAVDPDPRGKSTLMPSYTNEQADWLLAHVPTAEEPSWRTITREFNSHFDQNRMPYPLYKKWWKTLSAQSRKTPDKSSVPQPPVQKKEAGSHKKVRKYTAEQTEWMRETVPGLKGMDGEIDWAKLQEAFKERFGSEKTEGSLRSKWQFMTRHIGASKAEDK